MELKPIPSYPGYKITREGKVWSDKSNWWLKSKIHKFGRNKLISYNMVNLFTVDKKVRVVPIYRLLLEAFVGPRPEGMVGRHLDGDSLNDDLDNLCWGTYLENTQDMTKHYEQGKLAVKQIKKIRQILTADLPDKVILGHLKAILVEAKVASTQVWED